MSYLISIIGPTAVGKTALSIKLAHQYRTAILSCDARQVYKYMDIGTAKPSSDEMGTIPHYFIDHLNPDQSYTAGQFESESGQLLEQLFEKKKVVVSVGGSTLYNQALWYGLDTIPSAEPKIREALNLAHMNGGLEPLLAELRSVDPITYERIDRNNPIRVIRALEVFRETGNPISSFQTGTKQSSKPYQLLLIGLNMDRERLYDRINQRVDQMMAAGLEQEVIELLQAGYAPDSQALQSIGYRELISYISGEYDLAEAVRLIKRNSRRYAKRQLTWYRRDPNINWFEATDTENVLQFIESKIQAHS